MTVQFSIGFSKLCQMSVPQSLSQIYSVTKWLFPENMIMSTGQKKHKKTTLDSQNWWIQTQHHNKKAAEAQNCCEKCLKNSEISFFYWLVKNLQVQAHWYCSVSATNRNKTQPSNYYWDKTGVCVCDHKSHPDPWWTTTATRSYTQLSGKEFSGCKKHTHKIIKPWL